MADAKAEAKHLIEQSNARIENTIRNIREAQAEKEKTKDLRNELAEFKTQIETDTDEQDRIARKIAKIQRRQQRKADGGDSAKAKSAAEQKLQQPNSAIFLIAVIVSRLYRLQTIKSPTCRELCTHHRAIFYWTN